MTNCSPLVLVYAIVVEEVSTERAASDKCWSVEASVDMKTNEQFMSYHNTRYTNKGLPTLYMQPLHNFYI